MSGSSNEKAPGRAMSGAPAHERELEIGLARLREHLLNHAELIFLRVLEAAPGHPDALRYLGVTLCKLGRPKEGAQRLREAIAAGAEAWGDLAVALRLLGDADAQAAHARAGSPGTSLAALAFSTERSTHSFRLADYPYTAEIRYGAGRPPHPGLDALIAAGRGRYAAFVETMGELAADFAEIPMGGDYASHAPFWLNVWFPPLDGMALTQMLRAHDPSRFVEIGSGVSTKFARRAVERFGLRTRLVSIDPQPRNVIDDLCDQVIRKPLERCAPEMFEALGPGDVLFLDSSHRAFQGSDVTVFFLEILPRLKPGVIVHVHDIYLPDDYISGHVARLWNEQYLLATALLFGPQAFEILFPCWWVGRDPALASQVKSAVMRGPLEGLEPYGASFWLRRN